MVKKPSVNRLTGLRTLTPEKNAHDDLIPQHRFTPVAFGREDGAVMTGLEPRILFVFMFFLLQMVGICQSGKEKKLLETLDHIFGGRFIQELERQTL